MKETKIGNYRWTIGCLLFFAMTVNYLDRQVISLLKPILSKKFNWNESDYANIVIAFQLGYAVGMLGAGRLIDKIGTKLGYALSLTLWSIVGVLQAFAGGTLGLGILRFFLGVTEAGSFPAAVKTTAEWFPKKERALATGVFNTGTTAGAILAPLTVPWIAVHYGWQMAFIATGAIGLFWLIFWFRMYEIPAKHKKLTKAEYEHIHSDNEEITIVNGKEESPKISWKKLLTYKQTWAFLIGKFFTDGVWWFFLFWLPAFLIQQYKLVGVEVSFPIALVYIMSIFGSIIGGYLPMWYMKVKGWDIVRARKTSMFLCALFPLLVMFAQWAGSFNMWFAVIIIGIAVSAHQAWSANFFTIVSDMFPKSCTASVFGIGGFAGAIGSIILAKVAGLLFDHYKRLGHLETGYYIMFFVCGFAYVITWTVIFKILVPKLTTISIKN
jgi:ACS family hexuronate transporter-like MFS transporter